LDEIPVAFEAAGRIEGKMWLGQVKFFCVRCGAEVTDTVRSLIERRCVELSIAPEDLGEKARETAQVQMLGELGEKPANPTETAYVIATALMLLEVAWSPILLCNRCRSPESPEGGEDLASKVKLRLIKGGK
jgi:hypothetical protein